MITLLRETESADALNAICNHPAVRPWLGGNLADPLDLTALVADQRNVVLRGEHGAIVFKWLMGGFYEAHTQVLPSGRGAWTLELAQAALTHMFCRTDAVELVTRVPRGNLAARAGVRALSRIVPVRDWMTRPNVWIQNDKPESCSFHTVLIQDWLSHAPGLVEAGQRFHHAIDAEFRRLKRRRAPHADDENHDRYAGAAAMMVAGGQPDKACFFYNRWAVVACYALMRIASAEPLVLDINECEIAVKPDGFEVLPFN